MENSLFRSDTPEKQPVAPNPHDLIEKEVQHLKKGTSVRHGAKGRGNTPWLAILALCVLAFLYVMDPLYHAWYKGEAAKAYLYLHNYGGASDTAKLVASQILSAEEIDTLNRRTGSFQDSYASPDAAAKKANAIVAYMDEVNLLHAGKPSSSDLIGRIRCLLFIRIGLDLPRDWSFLDPAIN